MDTVTLGDLIEAVSDELPAGNEELVGHIVNDMIAKGMVRIERDEQKNAA